MEAATILEAPGVDLDGKAGEIEREIARAVERPEAERLRGLRDDALALAGDWRWADDGLARRLLVLLFDLQEALERDPTGTDPGWHARRALLRMRDVLDTMRRRLGHERLDDPGEAARYVVSALEGVERESIAELLGVGERSVRNWQLGAVTQIRKNPDRVVLVAQLVEALLGSWTPRGVVAWFHTPRAQLGGKPPLSLLERDAQASAVPLRELARSERGQLAT